MTVLATRIRILRDSINGLQLIMLDKDARRAAKRTAPSMMLHEKKIGSQLKQRKSSSHPAMTVGFDHRLAHAC